MQIYAAGQHEEAKHAFETLATIGDQSSLFNLGVMHFRGEAVAQNSPRAYALMRIASENSNDIEFANAATSIKETLADVELKLADTLYQELILVYGLENIKRDLLPRLLNDEDCPPRLKPIHKEPLTYPRNQQHRMGLVSAEFTISPEGYPREILVTSYSNKDFAKATLRALERYRYPPTHGGKPSRERHVSVYHFGHSYGGTVWARRVSRNLEELREKSENGDSTAQFEYARHLNFYRHFNDFILKDKFQYRQANEWYTRAASGGVINAQFEIGRNMLEGRGCEVDRENGFKWIKAAAVGGFSPAQTFLATSELAEQASSPQRTRSIISWLRNAAMDEKFGYPAKVLLAWELATSSEKSVLNADRALSLIEDTPFNFNDDLRLLETRAAAHALLGNYKKAVKFQVKAKRIAKRNDWNIKKVNERLALYQQNKLYVGSYY
ncbi:MAG: energy transducer TonB [Pseudomonadota bacterium]